MNPHSMDEVQDDEAGEWLAGMAHCGGCGWKWVAVWPAGAAPLECPCCGCSDTERAPAPRP